MIPTLEGLVSWLVSHSLVAFQTPVHNQNKKCQYLEESTLILEEIQATQGISKFSQAKHAKVEFRNMLCW